MQSKNRLLLLETSTLACSVALSENGVIVSQKYLDEPKAHAGVLVPFINDILNDLSLTVHDLSAVAVSEGPGSYTGLRVGVSTAKGICYGASIPLIAVSTPDILTDMALNQIKGKDCGSDDFVIIPMIDARRMEVYHSIYNKKGDRIAPITPVVLEEDTFDDYFSKGNIIFVGDGAEKYKEILGQERLNRSLFLNSLPTAEAMVNRAYYLYNRQNFKDVAYFEPFYLKDFIAGVSKKKII